MLARIALALRRDGWHGLARKIGRAVWRRRSHELFALPCRGAARDAVAAPPGVEFLVVDANNLDAVMALRAQARTFDRDVDDYFDDVRVGRAVAVLGHHDGRLVHFAFVFRQNKSACLLGLPRDAALIGNAYTVDDWRGRGLQGASVRLRAAIAREHGFDRVVAETAPDNHASQRGMVRGVLEPQGRLELLVLFNVVAIRWRRPAGVPWLGWCA